MRLTSFFTTILICFTTLLFAQETKIEHRISSENKLENGASHYSFKCFSEDGGVLIGQSFYKSLMVRSLEGYEMKYFDSDLKLKKSFIYEKKKSIVLSSIIKDNTIYLVEAHFEYFGKEVEFFMSSSPLDNINFVETKLFTSTSKYVLNKVIESTNSTNGNSPIGVSISPNKENFLINFKVSDKSKTSYHFYLFDINSNLIFKQSTIKNKKDRKIDFQNLYFDDENQSAYFLLKMKSSNKSNGGKYSYEIFKVSKEGVMSKSVDVGDRYFPDLKLFKTRNSPACLGVYSNEDDKKGAGVVYYKFNPDNLDLEIEKFSGLTEQYFIDKYGKEKDKETKNIFIRSIGVNDDNTILVNAEEYYTKGEEKMDQPTFSFYKDIIALKLDIKGNLLWSRNIDKYQGSASYDQHLSFKTIFNNGNSYLILNNSRSANFLKSGIYKLKGNLTEKCELLVLTINSDGEFSGKRILDTKENSWPFMTNDSFMKQESNSLLLIGRKGKKWQLLKLFY